MHSLPTVRTLRALLHGIWSIKFAPRVLVPPLRLQDEGTILSFDFTYKIGMGIWGKTGKQKNNLSFILASVLGGTGSVLCTKLVPTEKWEHIQAVFDPVLDVLEQAPEIIWVDD